MKMIIIIIILTLGYSFCALGQNSTSISNSENFHLSPFKDVQATKEGTSFSFILCIKNIGLAKYTNLEEEKKLNLANYILNNALEFVDTANGRRVPTSQLMLIETDPIIQKTIKIIENYSFNRNYFLLDNFCVRKEKR